MSIREITTDELRQMKGNEGLIVQGCGGSLQDWQDGINKMLTDASILKDGTSFDDIYSFKNGNLTCLMFPFEKDVNIDIDKLAVWRLMTHEEFYGTWLSDYIPNYLEESNVGNLVDGEGVDMEL